MKNDKETNIQSIKDRLKAFRDARDWEQFHDPKSLAEAVVVEAGELLELFLWADKNTVAEKIESDAEYREQVGEELADIMIYCIHFANATGLDLSEVLIDKIDKTEKSYPVEKSKGRATKYTKL